MSDKALNLSLSPNQRDLLVAALNSNQPIQKLDDMASTKQDRSTHTPNGLSKSSAPGSGRLGYDDSPFLDYPLNGEGDESFDFDNEDQMFGDLGEDDSPDNGTTDPDHLHDKRKSMGGSGDDEEGGGKRREGDEKQAKKPGRKPLMNEPTSVRLILYSYVPY